MKLTVLEFIMVDSKHSKMIRTRPNQKVVKDAHISVVPVLINRMLSAHKIAHVTK